MKTTGSISIIAAWFMAACGPLSTDGDRDRPPDASGLLETSTITDALSATGCSVVTSMAGTSDPIAKGNANPISGLFTRSFVPTFFRQGPWTGGLFVQDRDGLTLPAIASTGSASAWFNVPFQSNETVKGFSIITCGDGKSLLNVDLFAAQTEDNPTDRPQPIGSGGPANNPNAWQEYDVTIAPTTLSANSRIWGSITAASALEPVPSEALAVFTVYYD